MLNPVGLFLLLLVQGGEGVFTVGPAVNFGKIANVESDVEIPKDMVFNIRFDSGRSSPRLKVNSTFDSAARFINLKRAAEVPKENISIAIVVHGNASFDVTNDDAYGARFDGKTNGSAAAVAELQKHNVVFYICGQSAAFHGIEKKDLLPGVKLAHSAMTIHAILGKQGYLLNPF